MSIEIFIIAFSAASIRSYTNFDKITSSMLISFPIALENIDDKFEE
jgi:hypothetical protein